MEQSLKELYVARICAGQVRLRLPYCTLLLKKPTAEQVYLAQEVYHNAVIDAKEQELFTETTLIDWLLESEQWDDERENMLRKLPKEIEDFKVALYKATFKSNEKATIRKALEIAKEKYQSLNEQRHTWDYLTINGSASLCRSKYVIACSLFHPNGKPAFDCDPDTFWEQQTNLLEQAIGCWYQNRLNENEMRELARTEPWRSIWALRNNEKSLFGIPVIEYTEEQRGVVGWSQMFDSIYEHPERPSDDIITDDDALDGWMIEQRRLHQKKMNAADGESLIKNDKIKNSEEVYLIADTAKDAAKIDDMNDAHSMAIKKQRFRKLKERGELNEAEMPDTKQKIRMQQASMFTATATGKG